MILSIHRDHKIEAGNCQIIDVEIPDDGSKRGRGSVKISRSRKRNPKDVGRKDKMITIVVGALGTIPLRLKENLKSISVDTSIELIQRCALLRSARILRKVLAM